MAFRGLLFAVFTSQGEWVGDIRGLSPLDVAERCNAILRPSCAMAWECSASGTSQLLTAGDYVLLFLSEQQPEPPAPAVRSTVCPACSQPCGQCPECGSCIPF